MTSTLHPKHMPLRSSKLGVKLCKYSPHPARVWAQACNSTWLPEDGSPGRSPSQHQYRHESTSPCEDGQRLAVAACGMHRGRRISTWAGTTGQWLLRDVDDRSAFWCQHVYLLKVYSRARTIACRRCAGILAVQMPALVVVGGNDVPECSLCLLQTHQPISTLSSWSDPEPCIRSQLCSCKTKT